MSDSEEEACESRTAKKRVSKYQCPAGFASMQYSSACALQDEEGDKELWLIKAPARFDPKCFKNLQVPLSGLQMVQSSDPSSQIYSILSSRTAPSDLRLLISEEKCQKPVICSSGFSGVLKISESYGNCSENQGPVPIPAAPAPSIPAGLRQRFQPFGSSTPVQSEVAVVSPAAPKRTSQEPIEGEERKKKKKKKEKRQEDSEVVFIKEEETQIDCDQISELKEGEPTEERKRKKKKMKKEKERRIEDVVKTEPLHPSYGDCVDTPGKTKKKKKKSSRHE
ncbi:CD3e molecule, epsilon associated protein [Puntigrus tetrazona]|uniref:CD3e molecule, epsilon associated protein n=1 Tax=Puntigrus tetrazona TaxID=1606681 RepID=UPI001C89AC4F|nr:CD3e molecule, epsilon associated protein [Puntigrus tetrazona]